MNRWIDPIGCFGRGAWRWWSRGAATSHRGYVDRHSPTTANPRVNICWTDTKSPQLHHAQVPGPPALTREEVLTPFLGDVAYAAAPPSMAAHGRFRLRKLDRSRFDQTPAYGPTPPLCWVALFERV